MKHCSDCHNNSNGTITECGSRVYKQMFLSISVSLRYETCFVLGLSSILVLNSKNKPTTEDVGTGWEGAAVNSLKHFVVLQPLDLFRQLQL